MSGISCMANRISTRAVGGVRRVAFALALMAAAQICVAQGGGEAVGKNAGGQIKATDNKGREWLLDHDWKEGSRPYEKDLARREAAYLGKWGENWDGPEFKNRGADGNRISTPGSWKWEIVASVPEPLATQLRTPPPGHSGPYRSWGGPWPMPALFAPGGGEVTDFYASAGSVIIHCDLKSGKISVIGTLGKWLLKDGMDAHLALGASGTFPTADIVSGRVYWLNQGQERALRYLEKLLPYTGKTTGKEYLLPAILDYKELYKRVKGPAGEEIEPVMKDGQRADPSFVVRTTMKGVRLPGGSVFARPCITPDGKAVWLTTQQSWPRRLDVEFNNLQLRDIETGNVVSTMKSATPFPSEKRSTDGLGSHGAICMGLDGRIYVCESTGCSGGPMRLIGVNLDGGVLTHLYDSALGVNMEKRRSPMWDGPADALIITGASTLWQHQCPRTGAIINAGWDNSGIRRYHDGFVTSILGGDGPFRNEWAGMKTPFLAHHNTEGAVAPNGDIYIPDVGSTPQRIIRLYRTDWPKEQPEYGFGEKVMPRAKLEELMIEYAKTYIANYEAHNTF